MKISLRRLLSIALVLSLFILSLTVLSGCYVVKSDRMKKIEGTYMLSSYSGQEDYISSRKMTLFVVIRSDGTGYYAYRDKNTDPHIAELKCTFEADPESNGKYSYVSLNFGNGAAPTKFGVQAAGIFKISTNLNSTTLKWKNVNDLSQGTYSVSVSFTRVSAASDLSYVYEQFGEYDILPFGFSNETEN